MEVLAWAWDLKFVFVAYTVDMKVMTVILEQEKLQKDEEQVYLEKNKQMKNLKPLRNCFFFVYIFFLLKPLNLIHTH